MLLLGHIGVTLGILWGVRVFTSRLKTIIDSKYLAIGAFLPDLIDKPLGMVIFVSTFGNGRIIGHTLLFSLLLFFIGFYLYEKKEDIRILSLMTGSFFHIVEDQMWIKDSRTLFWPFHGLNFSKEIMDNHIGLELISTMFINSFIFSLSLSSIPEILGIGTIVILTLKWLIKRFRQNKF